MHWTILIADDEKINIHLIEKYLKELEDNYHILKAFDGKQAVEAAKNYKPDIVLLDWNMPLLSSFEVIKQIKGDIKTHSIPIILEITKNVSAKEIKTAFELGAVDFIRKPIDKVELFARLNSALKLSEAIKITEYQREKIDTHIEELNKLSLIIKQTDNSVIIFSPDGDMEWANEGFKRMYGISFEEFTKKYGSNIFEASFNPEVVREKFEELKEKKVSVTYISHVVNFGGIKEKWIQTTLTPILDGKEIEKVVAIETDITKQKQIELDLRTLTEKLKKTNEELRRQKELIQEERKKTENLLENILPHHVASQLKTLGYAKPRNYKRATVMFTDFKGFTKSCEHLTPDEIVDALHKFFSEFDDIVVKHYVEKIKTIGDAYMAVGGVPLRNRSNPFDVTLAGLQIQHFMNNLEKFDPEGKLPRWKLRVGIHTGPLVAGVVGKIKFAYDVWGDTVNIAKRMESADEVGRVNISGETYKYIKDYFDCEYRGKIEVKNRGKIDMYFVNGIKEEFAADEARVIPNEKFQKILNSL